MKNTVLIFLCFFLFNSLLAQRCSFSGGIEAGDYPPGCFLCLPVYQGNTIGFTPDTIDFDFPCGNIENSQWVAFEADTSGNIQLTVSIADCNLNQGVHGVIYDSNLNVVSDCFDASIPGLPGKLSVSGLIPGDIYYILTDGVGGDECDLLIRVSMS